jgi:hypothetical protein
MKNRRLPFYLVIPIVLLLVLAACVQNASITPTSNPPTSVVKLTAWTARTEGTLSFNDQCLRVKWDDQPSKLLLWPPDFRVTMNGNTLQMVQGLVSGNQKETDFQIGDYVVLGGGVPDGNIDKSFFQVSSPTCPGPYWVVGSIDLMTK